MQRGVSHPLPRGCFCNTKTHLATLRNPPGLRPCFHNSTEPLTIGYHRLTSPRVQPGGPPSRAVGVCPSSARRLTREACGQTQRRTRSPDRRRRVFAVAASPQRRATSGRPPPRAPIAHPKPANRVGARGGRWHARRGLWGFAPHVSGRRTRRPTSTGRGGIRPG